MRCYVRLRWLAHILGAILLAGFVTSIPTPHSVATAECGLVLAVPMPFPRQFVAKLLGRALQATSPQPAAWLRWIGHDRADFGTWSFVIPAELTRRPSAVAHWKPEGASWNRP